MRTKRLGNSDMHITPVGFGAWAIGGAGWEYGWGAQDDRQSLAAIHRALELGINWIDTAAVYGLGHSEELVAKALRGWSGPRPYVFTKCGMPWDERRQIHYSLQAQSVRRECEQSLRRSGPTSSTSTRSIGPPTIWPRPRKVGGPCRRSRPRAKSDGSVSPISASTSSRPRKPSPASLPSSPRYSLIRREAEPELLPFCQEQGIGVIVYSPMASGLLTGAMTRARAAALPPDDWRSRKPEFREPDLSKNLALVERLRKVGALHGRSPGEIAIAWVLRQPAVTAAIVGGRRPEQVEGIIGAADFRLDPADLREIENA